MPKVSAVACASRLRVATSKCECTLLVTLSDEWHRCLESQKIGRLFSIATRPKHLRVEIPRLRLAGKHELVVGRLAGLAPPRAEQVDDLVRDEHLALLVVLRCSERPVRVGATPRTPAALLMRRLWKCLQIGWAVLGSNQRPWD